MHSSAKRLFLLAALLAAPLCAADAFQAGFARTDITPAAGAEIPGGMAINLADGVRDPLFAEAAVFSSGGVAAAVVGVDLLMIPDDTIAAARRLAEEKCGIPAAHILVAASHTHCGGPIVDCFASSRDLEYSRMVSERIAEAVAAAHAAKVDARLAALSGEARGTGFNRRFFMRDGSLRTHPGKMNPDIDRPAGPVDPEVGVLAAETLDGELLGCVVNHAMHGTVMGGSKFSADWPFFLRQGVRGAFGRDIGVVFLNGACGDVTQVDNRSPRTPEWGENRARQIGLAVAGEVVKLVAGAEFTPDAPVAVLTERLDLPIRDLAESDEALVAREAPATGLGSGVDALYLKEAALVRAMKDASPTVPVEVMALRVGPAAIVTNPTEYFCALGLAIKQDQPWRPVMVSELTNGYAGYCATAEAYLQGGYETRTARSSFLAPGTGEQIVAASRRLLAALAPPADK